MGNNREKSRKISTRCEVAVRRRLLLTDDAAGIDVGFQWQPSDTGVVEHVIGGDGRDLFCPGLSSGLGEESERAEREREQRQSKESRERAEREHQERREREQRESTKREER
mgnify:CR=1 FL=1